MVSARVSERVSARVSARVSETKGVKMFKSHLIQGHKIRNPHRHVFPTAPIPTRYTTSSKTGKRCNLIFLKYKEIHI